MRPRFTRLSPFLALFFGIVIAPESARAFGGSAPDLARPGTFVISNRANVAFSHEFTRGAGTTIDIDPELDFMIVEGLSLGGAVLFHWDSGFDGGPSDTAFGVVPQVGYDLTLSRTWSFWPRLALTLAGDRSGFESSLEITAPFLVHPAEHFFFGAGPGLSFKLAGPGTAPPDPTVFGTFLVGGYFDH
ncbi:MAG: hypothetical protein FWD17_10595 [Polyangiaceae bacterium]|nr:hypothetical protein [Polyangiaceae bacterium]